MTEADGRHAEVVALDAAGERARGATLYVTLEPCAHHGTTPPCTDAIVAAGVERVVFGARDPNPEAAGGEEQLRAAGVEVELVDSFEARVQNEAWRTWVSQRRPFVIYKVAMTLDGRVTVPGRALGDRRGEPPARARAARAVDAVAVGGGTVRADRPAARRARRRDAAGPAAAARLRARAAARRRRARAARRGRSRRSSRRSPREGVQSLLLEGGPTLAAAFLAEDLVDKVLLFVAPTLVGGRPVGLSLRYPPPRTLSHLTARLRSATTCSSKRMSTSPDASQRADDEIVTLLCHWLTRQLGNDELRRKVEEIGTDELAPGGPRRWSTSSSTELPTAVPGERGQLEVLVRETVETLVYGD